MKLSDLAGPEYTGEDVEILGLTADSRAVKPGYLFAALKGVASDGRDYIPQALAAGASALLSESGLGDQSVPVVEDEEPRRRLAEIAARFTPRQPDVVVAVTGTNGKSSTVDFLRQIWMSAGIKGASLGTLGVTTPTGYRPLHHTTPDPIAIHHTLDAIAEEGVSHVALEASSHGLAQYRLDAVNIAVVGFTNLTQDHLDYHADFEDYFAAKMRLFRNLAQPGASAIINSDGDWGARVVALARELGLDVRTFGWSGEQFKLLEVWPRAAGQRLDFEFAGQRMQLELPLVGEFQALNALGAAGLALASGVSADAVFDALGKLEGVPGRMQLAGKTPGGSPVFVDFAHTPDGLDKLLRALRPHTKGRIVVVFGAGGDRDPGKRPLMGATAAKLADAVIVTDDNPRSEQPETIRAQVLKGCPDATEIGDRAAAIRAGVALLQPGDALVIAGRGHETDQIFRDRVVPFDDVEVAHAAIGELANVAGG